MTTYSPTITVVLEHGAGASELQSLAAAIRLLRGVDDVHVQPKWTGRSEGELARRAGDVERDELEL